MPIAIEQLEPQVYLMRIWETLTYDDVMQLNQTSQSLNENVQKTHHVFIIEHGQNTVIDLTFVQIRKLVANHNVHQMSFLQIDTILSTRLFVSAINKISLLHIELVTDMDTALQRAREILSNYPSDENNLD